MIPARKVQNWTDSQDTGVAAVKAVISFLRSSQISNLWYSTEIVHNVQHDKGFQALGVDLLWFVKGADSLCCIPIEVKGDRNPNNGNFFIETIGDISKKTPGSFISSRAEWYFYYYLTTKQLYCMPLYDCKPWFEKNKSRFDERQSNSTHDGEEWSTKGSLVPIKTMLQELPSIKCFEDQNGIWREHNGAPVLVEKESTSLLQRYTFA